MRFGGFSGQCDALRIGHMGHVLEAMLDMHTDPAAMTAAFGLHVVQCEPDEILERYQTAEPKRVSAKEAEITAFFDTPAPVSDSLTSRLTAGDLHTAARVAQGPTHHFALGTGHRAAALRHIADALGIETAVVPTS